ncbi:MAG: hypothetical protein AB8G15_08055 [Saprospiraceae bacterium]
MKKQKELSQLYEAGKKELLKIPGVLGVGFGCKETAGTTTDTTAFRIYVKEKRAPSSLSPEEQIPSHYGGIPTDVIKIPTCKADHCQDLGNSNKVIGGISISNLNDYMEVYQSTEPSLVEYQFGSIACIATIDNNDDLNKYTFLTNRHVIAAQGGQNGDTIYNPAIALNAANQPTVALYEEGDEENRDKVGLPISLNAIGTVWDHGIHENYPYEHEGQVEKPYFIDCAAVKIDTCISSWCKTNCGTNFKNEIKGLAIDGQNDIVGIKHITAADEQTPVFKVGRTTGRTVGKIVDYDGMAEFPDFAGVGTCRNIIIVEITEPNCNGEFKFSDSGDSGSAYINGEREIIGVHFGHSKDNRRQSFGGYIYPIMHKLGVTPITSNNADQVQDARQEAPALLTSEQGSNAYFSHLKLQLRQDAAGKALMEAVETYRSEVTGHVNHTRAVTVAWHRNKGPIFLQHCLKSSRDSTYFLPKEIEGVSFVTLINKMIEVLKKEGTYALSKTILKYEKNLRASISDDLRLEDFISNFIRVSKTNSLTPNPK